MSTNLLRVLCLALFLIDFNSAFAQGVILEGNSLSNREFGSDTVPRDTLFAVDFTVTNAGTLQNIVTWSEISGSENPDDETFNAYVLRPTGTNFQVMTDSGPLIVSEPGTNFFTVPPFALEAGDLIAHYGRGIPLATSTGGPSTCYYNGSVLPAPSIGDFLQLPGPEYPIYNDGGRNYAIAVNIGDRVPGENSPRLPGLNIALVGGSVVITWPTNETGALLQTADLALGPWTTNTSFVSTNGTNILTVSPPVGNMFFQLGNP